MKTKVELLGVVQKLPITDDNQPDLAKLNEPFMAKESVVKVFCSGCGHTSEITKGILDSFPEFAPLANLSLDDFLDKFVQVRRCVICDTKWRKAELVNINRVT